MQLPTLKAKYKRMFLILTIQTQMAEVGFKKESVYPLSIMTYIIKIQGNRGFLLRVFLEVGWESHYDNGDEAEDVLPCQAGSEHRGGHLGSAGSHCREVEHHESKQKGDKRQRMRNIKAN